MTTEVKAEKVPWLFLIPIIVLLGFFGEWWNVTSSLGGPSIAALGIMVICYAGITSLPFISLYFAGFFGRLFKREMNTASLTWIYIISLPISFFFGRADANVICSSAGAFISHRIQNTPEFTYGLIPSYMAPSVDVAKAMVSGGVAVPWLGLAPMIIFWWIYQSLWGLLMISIATIFRRQWMDVEKVPFVHATAAHELLSRMIYSPKESKTRFGISLTSPFFIGAICGFLFGLLTLFTNLWPWFPDIYGWRTNTCGYGSWYTPADSPLNSIAGFARVGKEPLGVAIAYLGPLNVLFGMWFWYIVILIVMQITYALGYYSGITGLAGCGKVWCGDSSPSYGPPLKVTPMVIGGIWGISIFLLVLSWRYLRDTLNAALGKMGQQRASFEKDEPMSYKNIYIFFIAIFIATMIDCMIMGMSLVSAVLTVVNVSMLWFAMMRVLGLTGVYYRKAEKGGIMHRLLLWPSAPEDYKTNMNYLMSAHINMWVADAPDMGFAIGGTFISGFMTYKMTSLTGVSNKSALKVLVASAVLGSLTVMLGFFYAAYTFGLSKLPGTYAIYGCDALCERGVSPDRWNIYPASEPWIAQFGIGFVIVGLLSVLHARYVWFLLEPVGFVAGLGAGWEWGFWSYALIAWVLKTLTLRVGGSKAYEKYGLPIAAGWIVGYALCIIPGTIIFKIRFFYPF